MVVVLVLNLSLMMVVLGVLEVVLMGILVVAYSYVIEVVLMMVVLPCHTDLKDYARLCQVV